MSASPTVKAVVSPDPDGVLRNEAEAINIRTAIVKKEDELSQADSKVFQKEAGRAEGKDGVFS